MAYTNDRFSQGFKAASAIIPKSVVTLVNGKDSQVQMLTNASQRPYGAVAATAATAGAGINVYEAPSHVKAIAAASLGAGAEVSLASLGVASGAQANLIATTTLLGPASVGASGTVQWAVGIAMSAAQGGDVFTVKLEPRQVSGLV